MSVEVAGPPSPSPSLIEVKEETRLVLKSFLRHALSIAPADRPGTIGGTYHDPTKYSVLPKEKQKKDESGWDSLDEKISAAEEKKHGIKNLIKRRLRPRPSQKPTGAHQSQNGSASSQGAPHTPLRKPATLSLKGNAEDEKSSASEEEGERKTSEKKKKKNKLKLVGLFKKKSAKKDEVLTPTRPPEFYDGVAKTLDRIAQQSVRKKSASKPGPIHPKDKEDPHSAHPLEDNKEVIIQQLVHLLMVEGDTINEKINANPLLRKSLNRMSYTSFSRLLESCANEAVDPPLPVAESPTLRRVAITMEMTRRVVTATGVTHRVEGYAERYMENFAPWVKSQGGWESIVQMEVQEFD